MNELTEQYQKSLQSAKEQGLNYIWSGDLRSGYLRECLKYGVDNKILTLTPFEVSDQETGFTVTWL